MRHGTPSAYNYGCHCEECTAAHRKRMYQTFVDLRSRPRSEVPHGTIGGYGNWGCRCEECTKANSRQSRDYYRRRLSPKTREQET